MDSFAQTIGVNLLTLIALTHLYRDSDDNLEALLDQVRQEVENIRRKAECNA